jgi:membrane fusion protein, heavy metal efflux system
MSFPMKYLPRIATAFAALSLLASCAALAHEGHDHGGAPGAENVVTGPVTLSEEAIKNLGVQTVEANLAPLQRSTEMVARIQGLPERLAKITPRAEGRVAEILVKLGDAVKAGQPLLRFEPLTVGNPPVVLKAPIGGYVIRQDASLGQSLTPESVLMEVADYSQVLARGMTFESADLALIQPGQPARVRLDVFPNESFEGKVQRLDVGLEPDSRTFDVYVLLENPELKLRPNMLASVVLGLGEAQDVLAVPQRALLGDTGNLFVFVQDGATFERRNVVLGMRAGDQVEILEGVLPGDMVVTQGNYQLQFATAAPKKDAAKEGGARPTAEEHSHEGVDGIVEVLTRKSAQLPLWAWMLGAFALGGFVFGFLFRRTA